MNTYRNRVTDEMVTAVQFKVGEDGSLPAGVRPWTGSAAIYGFAPVPELQNQLTAIKEGDWLVTMSNGRRFCCSSRIMANTFEATGDTPSLTSGHRGIATMKGRLDGMIQEKRKQASKPKTKHQLAQEKFEAKESAKKAPAKRTTKKKDASE